MGGGGGGGCRGEVVAGGGDGLGGGWWWWWVLAKVVGSGVVDEWCKRGWNEKKNMGGGRNDFEGMECLLEWVIPFH